ncbi:MAG: hypothetical protein WBJ10_09315 [Daejeonella sp.]|uniref:hypothetical protein n=1 Tax=Daejeonella sp. TaxID=2805397 RepID=UPI003C721B95
MSKIENEQNGLFLKFSHFLIFRVRDSITVHAAYYNIADEEAWKLFSSQGRPASPVLLPKHIPRIASVSIL